VPRGYAVVFFARTVFYAAVPAGPSRIFFFHANASSALMASSIVRLRCPFSMSE
jgi:hypothetical protein